MTRILPLLFAALASPAFAQDEANLVSAADILALMADRPFECTDPRPSTDSCSAVSTYERQGDTVLNTGIFLIGDEDPVAAQGQILLDIDGPRLCGELSAIELEVPSLPARAVEEIVSALSEAMAGYGRVCQSWYELGDDRYLSILRDEDGNPVPDGEDEVIFVTETKALHADDDTAL